MVAPSTMGTQTMSAVKGAPPQQRRYRAGAKVASHAVAPHRGRRIALLGTALMGGLTLGPGVRPSHAGQFSGRKTWTGELPDGTCALGEEGDDCRLKEIGKDSEKLKRELSTSAQGSKPSYSGNEEYYESTDKLMSEITTYLSMDVYDPARRKAQASIQDDGKTWVSKYAKGGSARLESAQKFYVVVDSLLGHFASQGYAPLQKVQRDKIQSGIDNTAALVTKRK